MKARILSVLMLATFFAAGLTIASCNEEPASGNSVDMRQMGAGHTCPDGQTWSNTYKGCVPICPQGYCLQQSNYGGYISYECLPKGECTKTGCPSGYKMTACGCQKSNWSGGCTD